MVERVLPTHAWAMLSSGHAPHHLQPSWPSSASPQTKLLSPRRVGGMLPPLSRILHPPCSPPHFLLLLWVLVSALCLGRSLECPSPQPMSSSSESGTLIRHHSWGCVISYNTVCLKMGRRVRSKAEHFSGWGRRSLRNGGMGRTGRTTAVLKMEGLRERERGCLPGAEGSLLAASK